MYEEWESNEHKHKHKRSNAGNMAPKLKKNDPQEMLQISNTYYPRMFCGI